MKYGGNPEHKKNPGDFNLTPPSVPRAGKSLCDVVEVFKKEKALELLQESIKYGLISARMEGNWPKNIWSVLVFQDEPVPLEAQLESAQIGSYHGYPMQKEDPFCDEIIARWKNQQ